jgi:hypothetical protein
MLARSYGTSDLTIAVPGHEALTILCSDQQHYSSAVLHEIAVQVARALDERPKNDGPPPLKSRQVKQLLQDFGMPGSTRRLAGLPGSLSRNAIKLDHWLRTAIELLEQPSVERPRNLRGTMLRMRYIEQQSVRSVQQTLHLSERHYYRLQAEGIAWLTEQLQHHLERYGEKPW